MEPRCEDEGFGLWPLGPVKKFHRVGVGVGVGVVVLVVLVVLDVVDVVRGRSRRSLSGRSRPSSRSNRSNRTSRVGVGIRVGVVVVSRVLTAVVGVGGSGTVSW